MKHSVMRRTITTLASGLALAAVLCASAPARAGAYAAADLDVGVTLYRNFYSLRPPSPFGLGAGGRIGWRFDVGQAWIAPELGGHYVAFLGMAHSPDTRVPFNHVPRILAGGRFGLGGKVQPGFYAHGGVGWLPSPFLNTDPPVAGPAFDLGFALDFALVRHFVFGAQLGYNLVAAWQTGLEAMAHAPPGPIPPIVQRWINVGVHAGVAF
jgi:hypothetical protein